MITHIPARPIGACVCRQTLDGAKYLVSRSGIVSLLYRVHIRGEHYQERARRLTGVDRVHALRDLASAGYDEDPRLSPRVRAELGVVRGSLRAA